MDQVDINYFYFFFHFILINFIFAFNLDNHLVEWHRTANTNETDGFQGIYIQLI